MINIHMAYRTTFKPKNIEKYVGDATKITCRSLWERNVCKFCDENNNVQKWSFEEVVVPYMSPIDQKVHNYFPDFLIKFTDGSKEKSWMIEVKPKKQTYLKENASKKEKITWVINQAKWKAAKAYCDKHGMEFKIITEKEIFANEQL
jgi:hypothetical protein